MKSACCLLVMVTFASLVPVVRADRVGQQLAQNQILLGSRSDYIGSSGESFRLVMQADCNLVLYAGSGDTPRPLWNSRTNGAGSQCRAIMQNDGNFVVYTGNNQPVWSSGTQGHPNSFVIMQDDGNLVVYGGSQPLWATMTNGQGFDIMTIVSENFTSIVVRIDRPDVSKPHTAYPGIRFLPGDTVRVRAGGCVQTGGMGSTWKRYVDPSGDNSDRLYHGRISIPTATQGLETFQGVIARSPLVVKAVPEGVDLSEFILTLGYDDDQYDDNGYYSHDDGTENQCQNVGNAFVELNITHAGSSGAIPPTPVPNAPMDLWWSQVDDNLLPLNPVWAMQMNANGTPNFRVPDVGYLCNYFHNEDDHLQLGNPPCTTGIPTVDEPNGWDDFAFWFACQTGGASGAVQGHINWGLATFTGALFFKDHSAPAPGGDDDYDMTLQRFDEASATLQNDVFADFRHSLALEYDSDETIDHFDGQWWDAFHTAVDSDSSGGAAQQMLGGGSGAYAIATGLLGIDTRHGAHAELHPVLGLMIRATDRSTDTSDHWVFFARPWGDEGGCSQDLHAYFPTGTMQFLLPLAASLQANVTAATVRTNFNGGSWQTTQFNDGLLVTINFPSEITALFGQAPKLKELLLEPLVWGELDITHDPFLSFGGRRSVLHSNSASRSESPEIHSPTVSLSNTRRTEVKGPVGFPQLGAGEEEYLGILKKQLTPVEWTSFVDNFSHLVQRPRTSTAPIGVIQPRSLPRSFAPSLPRHHTLEGTEPRVLVRSPQILNMRQLILHQQIAKALESVVGTTRIHTLADSSEAPRARPANGAFAMQWWSNSCQQGFVWREAFAGDRVCVMPLIRAQAAEDNRLAGSRRSANGADSCLSGFVWREAGPSDHVCVLPITRQQAQDDNRLAPSRIAPH